jgi:hypothetical protein
VTQVDVSFGSWRLAVSAVYWYIDVTITSIDLSREFPGNAAPSPTKKKNA